MKMVFDAIVVFVSYPRNRLHMPYADTHTLCLAAAAATTVATIAAIDRLS